MTTASPSIESRFAEIQERAHSAGTKVSLRTMLTAQEIANHPVHLLARRRNNHGPKPIVCGNVSISGEEMDSMSWVSASESSGRV